MMVTKRKKYGIVQKQTINLDNNFVRVNLKILTYSTVADSFHNEVVDPKNIKNLSLKISFTLSLENCTLNISHYTTYQKKLFRLVKFLKEKEVLDIKGFLIL